MDYFVIILVILFIFLLLALGKDWHETTRSKRYYGIVRQGR